METKTQMTTRDTVSTPEHNLSVCPRCGGEGLCRHEVAPWVTPVAQVPQGLSLAEVLVACDHCGGCGLVR